MPAKNSLSGPQRAALLATLKSRFDKNPHRHKGFTWPPIEKKLEAAPDKLCSLSEMENTGGEPDVISLTSKPDEIIFIDCAPQSPAGRRSFCYDRAAWQSRKEARPKNNALDVAQP